MSFSKFKKIIKIKLNQNAKPLQAKQHSICKKKIKYILKIKYKKEDSFQKI